MINPPFANDRWPYWYSAVVLDVHDGDTVTLEIDLGFGITKKDKFRLFGPDYELNLGLNAPELNTPEGKNALKFLIELLGTLKPQIAVLTIKDKQEKYGRYLAILIGADMNGRNVNINQALVDAGYATLRKYQPAPEIPREGT